jgi:hypothetical protein
MNDERKVVGMILMMAARRRRGDERACADMEML